MSTSETDIFTVGLCPCGAGTVAKHVTTQDNPWSGADICFTIECKVCASEWRLEHGHLVSRHSETEYRAARNCEENAYKPLRRLVDSLVEGYLTSFAAKSKKAELAEMTRLGITSLSYAQYLKHRSDGKTPAQACNGLRNRPWVTKLAETQSLNNELEKLLAAHEAAQQATKNAAKKIVRKKIA